MVAYTWNAFKVFNAVVSYRLLHPIQVVHPPLEPVSYLKGKRILWTCTHSSIIQGGHWQYPRRDSLMALHVGHWHLVELFLIA